MDLQRRAYLELHVAVLLFGFTAILGDWMTLPALLIVWWRVLITSISFIFIIDRKYIFRHLSRKQILRLSGIGVVTGLHWVFFFAAVQYSNASVTLVAMACTSFMVSLIEPLFLKKNLEWIDLLIGLIIVPAMALIVNNIDEAYISGIILGLISAFLAAVFTTLNKKYIIDGREKEMSFIELGSAWVSLSLLLPLFFLYDPVSSFLPEAMDWVYLLILALICTTLAYVLALRALNHISAFAASLTVNLEPVYGIFLAIFLLKEHKELNIEFYMGVVIIISAVTLYPILLKRKKSKRI
ncbi:DMT family transporter [Portibacter marinus]|uniref:DMT family transporter n=1 Tax=Portibacter marinus TaxID=2898660 RepID=UPI001F37C0B7|nr:DMT family transporter [Portibacter marinus]